MTFLEVNDMPGPATQNQDGIGRSPDALSCSAC